MKISKLAALVMGIILCIGALSGCGANNTAAIDKAELEQQIKAYLDANLDSYLDNYFGYESWRGCCSVGKSLCWP